MGRKPLLIINILLLTSRRFNRKVPHILFTNAPSLPMLDGVDVRGLLEGLRVGAGRRLTSSGMPSMDDLREEAPLAVRHWPM